jgi:hypothetical protein
MLTYQLASFANLSARELSIGLAEGYCTIRVESKHRFRRLGGSMPRVNVSRFMIAWYHDQPPASRRYRGHALL